MNGKKSQGKKGANAEVQKNGDAKETDIQQKLVQLGFELIDIGLYGSKVGYEYIQSTKTYELTDAFVNFDDRLKELKEGSTKLYTIFTDKLYTPLKDNVLTPLKANLYVLYDQSSHYVSFFFQVLKENQHKIREYVHKNYENVQVLIKDSWMRLDLNKDGRVDAEDLKSAIHELYEFLRDFDYVSKATEIKSTLYNEAIKYMKRDLQGDDKSSQDQYDEKRELI